ncbi:MAG: metallophosphoesterase [Candidatus Saccharicenans subterraneus]|uniref:Metallophosphoesterase n=1 Tax=Candidatus Saccharicenans subterraneus TaxID=2508984 RepID=A0A3E2BMJ0_9BACT|nr:MAG: metallophosphoesterase [Candidatus Saccharicenans subterraneum]
MRKSAILAVGLLLLVLNLPLSSQFRPEEIAQREELEEFLLTAEIIDYKEIGEGVTKPVRLFLKKGDVERSGVWKNPSGIQGGFLEGWQYEIAAYRLDKLLGLNMIPPTVERVFRGQRGSLQLWVEKEYSLLQVMEKNIPLPSSGPEADNWEKRKYISRVFDALIANEDRTQQNTLYTKDWRTILIDHSRSFRSEEKYTKHLLFGLNPLRADSRALPFRKLPRQLVENIKALTFDSIKQAVGPYLTDKEIRAVLARKDLILKEIDEMIKVVGEGKVLY